MSQFDFDTVDRLSIHKDLLRFGVAIRHLNSLKTLTLSDTGFNKADTLYGSLWLSPGDQHNVVHRLFQEHFPTLTLIVFSPWMVWYLRTPGGSDLECHCDLELLSVKEIREKLLGIIVKYDNPLCPPVRDWNGKLASAFREEPFVDEEIQGTLKAIFVDSS